MRKLLVLLSVPILALGSCQGHRSVAGPLPKNELKVLFLGNSLTYTNDLPGVFHDLAVAGGVDAGVVTVAYPNTALIDYLGNSSVMNIVDQAWDYVVMQQGTTSLPICRDTLVLSAQLLAPRIRKNGGEPALMMSWPSSDRQFAFPAVHDSFALAAQTVNGLFLPVGDAWLEAWKIDPTHQLYSSDGYHPAPEGTVLAALVIYEKLTGRDARQLPTQIALGGFLITLSEETMRQLQIAAHAANQLPVPKVVVPPTPVSTPITC